MLAGIASVLVTILAAIYTAFLLPSLQQYLSARAAQWVKQREEAEAKRAAINLTYLNPLRLWLEETYVRLQEIDGRLAQGDRCEALLFIDAPGEISAKDAVWFNEQGCYLTSACYLTACLFFAIKQVRENMPYLRLSRQGDTELMTLMFQVSHAFLRDFGVYYVTQPSLGNDIYLAAQQRLMTYREFCEMLQHPEQRVWCDRLILFYLEMGRGQRTANLQAALQAIRALSQFLDTHIGQGVSISERLKAEGL
ncbi:MAG: hypothetical protein F6J95_020555 [Leptolyngbya sp. SIO1E4]|nr:hypothetical protein [Leptolyngbya sp. SIO1E4]